jgi:hypothetical protein
MAQLIYIYIYKHIDIPFLFFNSTLDKQTISRNLCKNVEVIL